MNRLYLKLATSVITFAILLFFAIFSVPVFADHCPADYAHLNVVNACVRPVPPGGCEANESEQELLGNRYCILVGPAQNPGDNPPAGTGTADISPFPLPASSVSANFDETNLIGQLVGAILPIVLGIAGFLTVIFVIISGIQFVTSSGNPEAAAAARSRLIFALVGFVIIILAFAITQIVDRIFLGTSGVF